MLSLSLLPASAQQVREDLNRAPVAVPSKSGILVSWRSLLSDTEETSFNVYRDGKPIIKKLKSRTNFLDTKGTKDSQYTIETTMDGKVVESEEEIAAIKSFIPQRDTYCCKQAEAGVSEEDMVCPQSVKFENILSIKQGDKVWEA